MTSIMDFNISNAALAARLASGLGIALVVYVSGALYHEEEDDGQNEADRIHRLSASLLTVLLSTLWPSTPVLFLPESPTCMPFTMPISVISTLIC